MLYAVLCYHSETTVADWSKQEEEQVLAQRAVVKGKLKAQGKLGPVARLMPTSSAVTLRAGREPLVIDGPFAETKEQLLGFYIFDCSSLEEVIEAARGMLTETGSLEIRPLRSLELPSGVK